MTSGHRLVSDGSLQSSMSTRHDVMFVSMKTSFAREKGKRAFSTGWESVGEKGRNRGGGQIQRSQLSRQILGVPSEDDAKAGELSGEAFHQVQIVKYDFQHESLVEVRSSGSKKFRCRGFGAEAKTGMYCR